jgi:glucose dehydrogenase
MTKNLSFSRVLTALVAVGLSALAGAEPIDNERLRAASQEPDSWLHHGRDYSQQRFSPLSEVNRHTVARLAPAWIYQTGVTGSFQTTPLAADGALYLSTPGADVVALDLASGRERWRYRHALSDRKLCCGRANRGVALAYDKVFVATPDAYLIALHVRDGRVLWTADLAPERAELAESRDDLAADDPARSGKVVGSTGLGANMAPLVFQGRVYVGVTGEGLGLHIAQGDDPLGTAVGVRGHRGGRGYLVALNARSGRELWRWYSVPEEGWEGAFSSHSPDGNPLPRDLEAERAAAVAYANAWAGGGGSIWTTPSVDPRAGLLFLGTGNPAPQMDDATRPGDNLHTASIVALNAGTGELRWAFQQVPHDRWGYDVASPPVLFDWVSPDGDVRQALAQAGKTGWLYILDRLSGELLVRSQPFVPQENLFAAPNAEGVRVAPGAAGGSSWSPVALDPRSGTAYVAALHLPMHYQVVSSTEPGGASYTRVRPLREEESGRLSAIDTATGEVRWQVETEDPLVGGVLATGGDLVFSGEGSGRFVAYEAESGKELWSFQCGAGVNAPAISVAHEGRQYIVVAAGGHERFGFPQGDAVIAFALPQTSAPDAAPPTEDRR